jgi:hypothetical protein
MGGRFLFRLPAMNNVRIGGTPIAIAAANRVRANIRNWC